MHLGRSALLITALGLPLAALVACGGSGGGYLSPAEEPPGPTVRVSTPAAEAAAPSATAPPAAASPVPTVRRPGFVSLADLTTDVAVPELPGAFAAAAPDAGLEAAVRAALAGREGAYSVVVHNLATGRYAAVNEGQVYYAASLFKLGLLLEAYRQRDAGELDFARELTLEEKYAAYDLGTLELLGLQQGDSITLADALKAMIVVSDTPSAVMVQDTVKAGRVDATLRSLGIADTSFNDYDLPATARDIARLLTAIAAGEGVGAESRREMLSLLLQEAIREGVPAGLPGEVAVAHKTGNWQDATHNAALVWGPAGPYVIVVMTDRSWEWEPVVQVSRSVWQHFAANP